MKSIFTALTLALWLYSETTSAQAVMVKDINLGSSDAYPMYLTNVRDTLYFKAETAGEGMELWKSDGTAAGTVMVKEILAGPTSPAFPHSLVNFKDTLYFLANDGTTGIELWKSDGTAAGTGILIDINPGTFGALDAAPNEGALTNFKGALYFIAYNGINGTELWKTNGSAAGTVMVKNISNGSLGTAPTILHVVNNTLYFRADDGVNGDELWKSDGTGPGTVMVKDIYPGATGSSTVNSFPFTSVNDTVYFWARTAAYGDELWKSDGTAAGTVMVKDINPGGTGSVAGSGITAVSLNGIVYFTADDGSAGRELWKTDGTAAGTVMVKDITPGSVGSNLLDLTLLNGAVYFVANDGTNGIELWKTDGTGAGTQMVADIAPGGAGGVCAYTLKNVNGTLYFCGNDGTNGNELWKSDGTALGTVMAADVNSGAGSSNPALGYLDIQGIVYFGATDGVKGSELWKYDPTATAINKIDLVNNISIYPNPFSSESVLKTTLDLENATLIIYNSFGQEIKEIKNISGRSVTIHRDGLSSGLYLLRLMQDSKIIAADKLVITD